MLLALEPEDVERFAIPIGIAIAALLVVAIPSWRRGLMECFRAGKRHGERLSGREKPEDDENQPNAT
jgi:hypothetical protein